MRDLFSLAQKPIGVKHQGNLSIDWSHSLAKDLKVFLTVQNGNIVDLVSGRIFDQNSTNYVTGGLIQTGINGISYGTFDFDENKYLSVHGKFIYPAYSDAALIDIDNQALVLWADNNLSTNLRAAIYTGTVLYGADGSLPLDKPVVWGGNIKGSSSGGIFVSGTRINYGGTGTSSVSSKDLTFFATSSGGKDSQTLCEFVYIANRELSDYEVKSLHADPYQILKPDLLLPDVQQALFETYYQQQNKPELRLTSSGLVDISYTGLRLTSGGLIQGTTPEVKSAIRSASGWAGMSQAEQDVYGGRTYSLVSTWEADIPEDLVAVDQKWIAECYNDWPSFLSDNVDFDSNRVVHSSGTSIELTVPVGERHNGIFGNGFKMQHSTNYVAVIGIGECEGINVNNIELNHTGLNGTAIGTNYSDRNIVDSIIGILADSTTSVGITYAFSYSDTIIQNCLMVGGGYPFRCIGNYTYNKIYNCTAVSARGIGFSSGSTSVNIEYRNNIAYDCATDYTGTFHSDSSNNATSGSTLDSGLGTITDITSADFVDSANDDYNITRDSQLFNTGADLSLEFKTDIRNQPINQGGSTYYFPIGAFTGPTISALRDSQATFDAMSDSEKAVYNNRLYTLMSTWETDIPSDLVESNIAVVVDCYNDWQASDGLTDQCFIPSKTVSSSNNITITVPEGHRHNGVFGAGFKIKSSALAEIIETFSEYTVIEYIEIYSSNNNGRLHISDDYCVVNSVIAVNNTSGPIRLASGINHVMFNCIAKTTGALGIAYELSNYSTGNVMNCIAIDSYKGFNGRTIGARYFKLKNCLAYNCTTNYASEFDEVNSTNNAASDGSTVTPPGLNPLEVDITSTDFVDAANDDYNIVEDSALFNSGADLSTTFTTDIRGQDINIGNTTYYFPIGAFTGPIISALRDSQTTFDAMTDAQQGRYGNRLYTLMSTWESDIPTDLVSDNIQIRLECFNDWSSGLADNVDIVNTSTTATNNIIVRTASGSGSEGDNYHNGDIDAGFFLTQTGSGRILQISADFTEIKGIRVASVIITCIQQAVGIENILIEDVFTHDSSSGYGIHFDDYATIINCISVSCNRGIYSGGIRSNSVAYNCTVDDCGYGIIRLKAVNCVAMNSVINDYFSLVSGSDYNASSDSSATNTNDITGVVDGDFVDVSNNDYSLSSDSALIDEGTDLSAEGFDDDITGYTRG